MVVSIGIIWYLSVWILSVIEKLFFGEDGGDELSLLLWHLDRIAIISSREKFLNYRTDSFHTNRWTTDEIMLIDTCRNYHSHAVLYDTEIEGIKELRCSPLETETFNISIKNDLKIIWSFYFDLFTLIIICSHGN